MTICFIANKDLTENYHALARHLQKQGEEITWLSPSTRWTRWLISNGWDSHNIFNMPDHQALWKGLTDTAAGELAAPFESDPTLTASHAVLMCRGLSRRDPRLAFSYIAVALDKIHEFLKEKDVELVFGEGTWGFEIAAGMACRRLKIPHLCPSATRIPSDRFCFVDAITSSLWDVVDIDENTKEAAASYLEEWLNRPRPPAYAQNTHGYVPYDRAWWNEGFIGLFRPELDRDDETLWTVTERITDRAVRAWRSFRFSSMLKFKPIDRDKSFVLICLQHQPEAAVDVFGGFHSDQLKLIETISRMIPANCQIVVREHRGAIGDRPASWYKRAAALPKVVFSDPFEDIFPLLSSANAVVTVSSTVAFEAAMLGAPSLLLAPVHFSSLAAVEPKRSSHPLDWPLKDIIDIEQRSRWTPSKNKKVEVLARIFANSAIGDPAVLRAPESVTQEPSWMETEANFTAQMIKAFRDRRENGQLVLGY